MATLAKTQQRRALQKLFNAFESYLSPHLSSGIVLAISGGPDSRALLEALARWPQRNFGNFVVFSLDHGLRPESRGESDYIAMRAQRLGFKVQKETLLNLNDAHEALLRQKRYELLQYCARENSCKAICTAHHLGDNAEGFLMSLFGFGGGKFGSAMLEEDKLHSLKILRPFLGLKKAELMLALLGLNISDYAADSLDEDRHGRRAFVRHEIISRIPHSLLNFDERLNHFARQMRYYTETVQDNVKNSIQWEENRAIIDAQTLRRAELESALSQVLKELTKSKDLRQAGKTLHKITSTIERLKKVDPDENSGLDPTSKQIRVSSSESKSYHLPGAVVSRTGTRLVIERTHSDVAHPLRA
jgi:tRNA(Ile)-lysidine synthetase-like protein